MFHKDKNMLPRSHVPLFKTITETLGNVGSIDLKFVMSDKFLSFYGFERFRFEVNIIPCNTFHENILIVYLNDGIFFLIINYYICKTKLKTKE